MFRTSITCNLKVNKRGFICRIRNSKCITFSQLQRRRFAISFSITFSQITHPSSHTENTVCYLWAQSLLPLQRGQVRSDEAPSVRVPAHFVDCTQLELEDNGVTGVEMVFCQKLQQWFVNKVVVFLNTQQVHNSQFYTYPVVKSIPTYPQYWRTWRLSWPELLAPTSSVSCPPDSMIIIKMPLSAHPSPPWLTSPPRSPRTCRAQSQAGADSGPPHTRGISPRWCSSQPQFLELWI